MINFIMILQSPITVVIVDIRLWHVIVIVLAILAVVAWGIWDVSQDLVAGEDGRDD